LTDTIRGRANFDRGEIELPEMNLTVQSAKALSRIVIAACGTSIMPGCGPVYDRAVGADSGGGGHRVGVPYRNPVIDPSVALLTITQSGETVDTLAAMELADAAGCPLWTITNVIGSQAHRMSDGALLIHAGPEIGVASTKTFTGSQVDMYNAGLYLAQLRGTLDPAHVRHLVDDLPRLPDLIGHMFDRSSSSSSWPMNSITTRISCSWGAASTIRSRWKAR